VIGVWPGPRVSLRTELSSKDAIVHREISLDPVYYFGATLVADHVSFSDVKKSGWMNGCR
jgi:hypothetical protein